MIPQSALDRIDRFAREQAEQLQAPSVFHIDLALELSRRLADRLRANWEIVRVGLLLMDCQLGEALKRGEIPAHVRMSESKAEEILNEFSEITDEEKANILACVREHHGAEKFTTLESEVCCNADCYRFASIKGFIGGMVNSRDMPLDEMVDLYSKKADEKWNALSLDICKEELRPQYEAIKRLLSLYRP